MKAKEILASCLILVLPVITHAFDCGYDGYKGCATAQIEQIGFNNKANIETSGINKESIVQEGFENNAVIKQIFALFGNYASILQFGYRNSAYQNQTGINNYVYAEQVGSFNSIVQNQSGNGNIATAKQFGVGNTAVQNQYTSFNSASVVQIGFYNRAYQFQGLTGTTGNKSNLTQIGYGVLNIIIQ